MVTVNQITPITFPDLPNNTALTGNEYLAISQNNTSAKVALSGLPAGFEAGVVVYGNTGGAPFPNYRTLTAGRNITLTDGGAQGDLIITASDDIGSVSWGNIEGTLSNQTDLTVALNAKLDIADNLSDINNANTALNNLLPSQSGHGGEFLTTDGTNTSWTTNAGGDVSGPGSSTDNAIVTWDGTTGTTVQNSPVTISSGGTISSAIISGADNTIISVNLTSSITGTLPIANGGTNGTTATMALNNLLPSQSGHANAILNTDGTDASWTDTPQLSRIGLGQAADSSAVMQATGQYNSVRATCTTTLDWDDGNCQTITLANGSQTFTFANGKSGARYLLELKQPASGTEATVTWPATVKWASGATPTLTTTSSRIDIMTFYYNGTNYFGSYSLNYSV